MRRSYQKFVLFIILLFPLSLNAQALSGTKTIGSGGDYTTISDAITALHTNGISGSVTFNILSGTYDENLIINFSITGSTALDTVLFQSSTGNVSDVTLQFSGTASPHDLLTVENTANISFKNLTFQYTGSTTTLLSFGGTLNNINFINNIFNGDSPSNYNNLMNPSSSISSSSGDIVFDGNTFNNAYKGLYLKGNNTPGLKIINNTFSGQGTAVYLDKGSASVSFDSPIIESNVFSSISSYVLHLTYCSNNLKIISNKVTNFSGDKAIDIEYSNGTASGYGMIANNILESKSDGNANLIYLYSSSYQKIYFNSISIDVKTYYNRAALGINITGGSNINIENNLVADNMTGTGSECLYTNSISNIALSDYNAFYSKTPTLISWGVTNYTDLSSFQSDVTSQEQHSLEANPFYVSTSDLTPNSGWINNKGNNSLVTGDLVKDFNGNTRSSSNPDIGAIEYTPDYSPDNPLSGPVYTIGSSGADFTTLTDAILQMEKRGVSRGLRFQFLDGSYNEQISFDYIPGLNQSNPLVIESKSLDSSKVDIHYSGTSANNYVIQLANIKYVTFKDLRLTPDDYTHSVIVSIGTNANNDNFINDNFYQPNLSAYNPDVNSASGVYTENLLFDGCQFNGGNEGIDLDGTQSNPSKNIQISNCNFTNFTGTYGAVRLNYYESPYIYRNDISSSNYGISLITSSGSPKILKNKIIGVTASCLEITSSTFSASSPALIADNFFSYNTSTSYYNAVLVNGNNSYINFYYNSFNSTHANAKTFQINSGSNNINIMNNIFKGSGLVLQEPSGAVTSDYNDFYTTGTNLINYNGTNYTTLSAYQTASSHDAHSISADPGFTSISDLHASTAAVSTGGTPSVNSDVSDDIDDELRDNTTPSIGADEFTTTAASGTMAGTYKIGSTTGDDYSTISSAVNDLRLRGISGLVDLKIDNGTYSEQVNFPSSISGSSSSNKIIFESNSGNAADVIIEYTASSYSSNYVINLNRASYITFKNVTISALGTNYATCVLINSGASNLNFTGDIFNGVSTTQSSSNFALIYSSGSTCNSLTFQNNTFSNGSEGIDVQSGSATYATGMDIENNTFSNVYDQAVYVFDYGAPIVKSNTISNSNIGVDLGACDNNLDVEDNKISGISDRGIIIDFCTGTSSTKGLTANNFIQSTAKGIYLTSSSYQQIYYNTVSIKESPSGSNTNSECFVSSSSNSNNFLENNLFVNNENGLGAFFINNSSFSTIDYNDYYSAGTNLIYYNGSDYQNISSYKSASGTESHSVDKNVTFTSLTDLHLSGGSVGDGYLTGIPLSAVTIDIDGDTRSATYPYKGADEATASPLPVELNAFSASINNNQVVLNWTTSTEVNNYGFEVQRIINSKQLTMNNWKKIGFVTGSGNSNSIKKYSFKDENISSGKIKYRLKQINNDGTYNYSKAIELNAELPAKFELSQNYPNPFNPVTTIKFSLPQKSNVRLIVYNSLGQKVETLLNELLKAGYHQIKFSGNNISSGIYFYRLDAGKYHSIKKMILLK